ncbi:zeta toxin family protein [Chryseobacterium vaccae]|uniref:zeta toxin family protein n=1 Tax=Chryseobacterium vaccae TaxID=2604424 RepID=UPI001294DFF4|nr:zeta toxin family protein [Chryseobacterium vaccae]
MSRPQFFLLAGPNGAGKSTYSGDFIPENVFYFNGDEIYAELLRRYPNYDPEKLKGGVPSRLEKEIETALSLKKDFAFESNFSTDMAAQITKIFIDAGYQTNLIYFGLDNINLATSRVTDRVALGKHDVSPNDIKFNYDEGVKRVNENFELFNIIRFVDTTSLGVPISIAYYLKDNTSCQIINKDIQWFNTHFSDSLKKYVKNRAEKLAQIKKSQIQINPPKKGKGFRR